MRKGSEVIGKVVVTYDTGRKIERIHDLIFDQNRNQLLGFLVEEKGLFRDAKVIPLENVKAIGADIVVVHSEDSVVEADQFPAIQEILRHNNVLKGTKIFTTKGLDLGRLVDLFFDDHSGRVEGYEVSGGVFADAYSGRSFVPAPDTLTIGYDVAFVPLETAQMMEEQVGGIRGMVQTTGDRLHESAETANRKFQVVAQQANEQLQGSAEILSHKLQAASQSVDEQLQTMAEGGTNQLKDWNQSATSSLTNRLVDPKEQRAYVIGKSVNQDVLTPDGNILIGQGQNVTFGDAETAEVMGILDRLYRATGGSLTANISKSFQAATDSASRQIQNTAQDSATNLRHSADSLVAHATIAQARGRRVLRMVRADDGLIIAAIGQIVNEPILDRAQANDKEAELLHAVGLASTDAVRSSANDTWSETRVQLHDSRMDLAKRGSIAQDNLNTFWHNLQEKVKELQGRSARAIKQQRIEQALGRPVTRVILDPEDNVILNVGELITHHAIHRAEDGGVLSILLSSVYTKEPEISDKELRASEHGMAALEHYGNGQSQLAVPSLSD